MRQDQDGGRPVVRVRRTGRAREIIHRARREIAHALEVPERAFALEAWAARDVDLRDLRHRRHRRRVDGRRRSEERDQRHADGGRRVHQPGVVADDDGRERQEVDRGAEVGAAGEVAHLPRAIRLPPAAPNRPRAWSLGEPTSHTCMPSARKRARELGEVRRRPALGRTVFGAGAEDRRLADRCEAAVRARPLRGSRDRAPAPGRGGIGTRSPGFTASAAKRSTSRGSALASSRRMSLRRP